MNFHELPVYRQKDRILSALAENRVLVVESPTGSGKTTQLPIILHEAGFTSEGIIGITQPRRIAALSVSDFIARQLSVRIPDVVGYKMRFEDSTDSRTILKVMTDGILLQELKADPQLSRYGTIIVDEAHERSLNIDFVLGLLKRILAVRPSFKIIISSATMKAEVFSEYFDECPIIRIDAEMYPVDLRYLPGSGQYSPEELTVTITEIIARHVKNRAEGDVLVFLPGEQAIKDCAQSLTSSPFSRKLWVLPLYGRLSKEEQERVFIPPPPGKCKVVVATNIAETSVTIDGITLVIDSGLGKLNFYNPKTFTSSLIESPVSKASCNQRKGRAGRTRPGLCYRLFSKDDFDQRPLFTTEEIFRTDLSEVVLRMAELDITDFESFDFISPPGKQGIISAVETLYLLDALEENRSLSPIGTMMARFPLLPKHSRMIIEAIHRYPDVLEETIVAASFLTVRSPFLLPHGEEVEARRAHHRFRHDLGDFVSYLILLDSYSKATDREEFCSRHYLDPKIVAEVANVKHQLEEIVGEMGIPVTGGGPHEHYLTAVSRGLIQFVCARTEPGTYRSLTAGRIQIHPGSVMFRENPRYIVAGEIVRTSKMFARSVSPLERSMIQAISPELAAGLVAVPGREGEAKPKKDTSWSMSMGGEVFELKPYKGKKKIVVLPWEKLRQAVSRGGPSIGARYSKLRGKVTYRGSEFMHGTRISIIVSSVPFIDPEEAVFDDWPRGKNFDVTNLARELCSVIPDTLKLCRESPKKKDRLGFLTLSTDGQGAYWFVCGRNFTSSLEESLASLEILVDEIGQSGVGGELLENVNVTYRRLAGIYES